MSNQTTSTEKLLSACTGSLITSVMVTPMDVVKMRMQTQHYLTPPPTTTTTCCMTLSNCIHTIKHGLQTNRITRNQQQQAYECRSYSAAAINNNNKFFKGTLDGIYKIVKYEGVTALWKGLSPALVMSVPANVIYFVGYEYLRDWITQPTIANNYQDYAPLIAGALARTIAVAMISPIELFRTRLQASTDVHTFKDVLDGVKKMVAQDGCRALWRGLPPTLWRDVPFSAIYWMGYEKCKASMEQSTLQFNEIEMSFAAGALSGIFAAAITTPFDVAKTQRQVDAGRDKPMLIDSRVPGILKQIYYRDGFKGLFRGLTPRMAKIGPSCAIMISSYEMGKTFFSNQHNN